MCRATAFRGGLGLVGETVMERGPAVVNTGVLTLTHQQHPLGLVDRVEFANVGRVPAREPHQHGHQMGEHPLDGGLGEALGGIPRGRSSISSP